ncbi:MAG: SIS domain-containing protein [Acidimicrobiales bacterium]
MSPPSFVDAELESQPDCWRAAAQLASDRQHALPADGERVAAIGCGTSRSMAQAYAARREALGLGETDAFAASQFPLGRRYDSVVLLSRSGTTTEVVRLLDRIDGPRTIAITAAPDSPLAARATETVLLTDASERSVVQTRFATTALALLRASLADGDLDRAITDADQAIPMPLPATAGDHEHLTFLGLGWVEGLADEAALKCREAASCWAESYAAMEYRHGPMSAAGPRTLVWALGPLPAGLADETRDMGATVVTSELEPMAELIRVQRFAVALARQRGLDPDHPRGLSFSVLLDGDH